MSKESNNYSQNHIPKETNIQTHKKSVPAIRDRKPENHKKHITKDGRKQNGRD